MIHIQNCRDGYMHCSHRLVTAMLDWRWWPVGCLTEVGLGGRFRRDDLGDDVGESSVSGMDECSARCAVMDRKVWREFFHSLHISHSVLIGTDSAHRTGMSACWLLALLSMSRGNGS